MKLGNIENIYISFKIIVFIFTSGIAKANESHYFYHLDQLK